MRDSYCSRDSQARLWALHYQESGAPGLEGALSFPGDHSSYSTPCQQEVHFHNGMTFDIYVQKTT